MSVAHATYDGLGRPDQLKRSTTVLLDFNWNADGTVASGVDGDAGVIGTTTFSYDWADRLTSAVATPRPAPQVGPRIGSIRRSSDGREWPTAEVALSRPSG